ncbi:hypothetical protein [Oceanobacillus jeddahense]|uniref:Glycine zipper family protein n=1 Tax=Oceanobacillus jeddahense TaxID=1462527 RepID=A0ABY5JUN0_9BACI|nr:hypothetical protein [Oceanobacillus jeddahense]UUI03514.1 hypothetical protein NP439_02115 [Oceanobacillus jeddahense]
MVIGGFMCLGIGIGLFTGNVAAGTMIGIGLGLVGEALFQKFGKHTDEES